jgi:hypothetical protein
VKVKVDTKQLIELVVASKRALLEDYAARKAAYPEQVETYRRALVKALEQELVIAKRGGRLPDRHEHYSRGREVVGVTVDVGVRKPDEPRKPDTKRHDRRLAELRLETRDALLIDRYDREWSGLL